MTAAKKIHTIGDLNLENLGERAQIIDGQVVEKQAFGGEHASKAGSVQVALGTLFSRKKNSDGRGGWWILPEVTIAFAKSECAIIPDISGWKRENCPNRPSEYPVKTIPNWICEICYTTEKKDTKTNPEIFAKHGVEYYWLVYVESENLQVFKLNGSHYSLLGSYFREDKLERIPPFELHEVKVGVLLGNDPED